MTSFKKFSVILILFLVSLCYLNTAVNCEAATKKILLVGNSYIFFNELPGMLNSLIESSGQKAVVSMSAKPGWNLKQHSDSRSTTENIKSTNWDYVVLQEQSVLPAYSSDRQKKMIPAVKSLNQVIKSKRAHTVLLMTWGRRDGLKNTHLDTYAKMQQALTEGYTEAAKSVRATIAPVGVAWSKIMASEAYIPLYRDDGSHPNPAGTYLTACVLYATLYKKSPEGLSYTAGLGASRAKYLQTIAAETVLTNQYKWNLK